MQLRKIVGVFLVSSSIFGLCWPTIAPPQVRTLLGVAIANAGTWQSDAGAPKTTQSEKQTSNSRPAPAASQPSEKKEHNFQGTVAKVDIASRTVTVNGQSVPGWMAAMTMTYHVDKPATLGTIKAGDHIAAKVYDGDVSTLHGVHVVIETPGGRS